MKTLIELSRSGKIPPVIHKIAKHENLPAKEIMRLVACGKVVVPANSSRHLKHPCGIGKNMSVKINANIGTSPDCHNLADELRKLNIAIEYGADTIMDLSLGGDLQKIQKALLAKSTLPFGTVPIYEAAKLAQEKRGNFLNMTKDDILDVISRQAKNGVDFFTLHCGVTKKTVKTLFKNPRMMGIVSRGGALLARWIKHNQRENPLFEYYDEILGIAKQYDVTLSLGDGLRPGSIFDATDKTQLEELKLLGVLAKTAQRKGVQVMIEGPGHVPINQIKRNIDLEKKYCNEAPFYVLGPLVTDIAVGYDHIPAAIGSAIAASLGADFLCFVTPAEHLKLPDTEDIKLGVISSRIAAHSADLARGNVNAWQKDKMMSLARKQRDWTRQINLSLDPQKIRQKRRDSQPKIKDVCTMCGEFCSIKLMEKSNRRA